MKTMVPQRALASYLSTDSGSYSRGNWSGNANPVGNTQRITREMAPLDGRSGPRVMHPAINSAPWSTSMAVLRAEPRSVRKGRWSRRMRGK